MEIMSDTKAAPCAIYFGLPQANLLGVGTGKCFELSNACLGARL